jgi:hypothetical protein
MARSRATAVSYSPRTSRWSWAKNSAYVAATARVVPCTVPGEYEKAPPSVYAATAWSTNRVLVRCTLLFALTEADWVARSWRSSCSDRTDSASARSANFANKMPCACNWAEICAALALSPAARSLALASALAAAGSTLDPDGVLTITGRATSTGAVPIPIEPVPIEPVPVAPVRVVAARADGIAEVDIPGALASTTAQANASATMRLAAEADDLVARLRTCTRPSSPIPS